jgi:predicted dehydrogenase
MRFALLGSHPDGLDFASALAASGRHELAAYNGPESGLEVLRQRGLNVQPIGDIEEILADPAIEAVIVAGKPATRPEQLRRALQSERHVLCVHPADQSPDIAYEAAMIQGDTQQVLLPLMPDALHPAIARLAELTKAADGPLGSLRLVEMERWSPHSLWIDSDPAVHRPSFPGWDVLWTIGGPIVEVSAFAAKEELSPNDSVLLTGRFDSEALFRSDLLAGQDESRLRLALIGNRGRAELVFPSGWSGPAQLSWRESSGTAHEENWPVWDPWPPFVDVFEAAVGRRSTSIQATPLTLEEKPTGKATSSGRLSWQDAIRCQELDDAARRSIERRRASLLEYPEANEEVGFKGTMTLVGCAVIWTILFLLILSVWVPQVGWLIAPVLLLFLGLQLFRWIIPSKRGSSSEGRGTQS